MDIAEFYAADERRRTSVEEPYGDCWLDPADRHATYRARWVVDTGELYVVREPQHGGTLARFLESLHVEGVDVSELRVEVLATLTDHIALDQRLAGWPEATQRPDGLHWLRERSTTGSSTGAAG